MKKGDSFVTVTNAVWAQFGKATVDVMADGTLTLAMVWQSAWNAAKAAIPASTDLGPIEDTLLQALYEDPGFVPSLYLGDVQTVLKPKARKKPTTR